MTKPAGPVKRPVRAAVPPAVNVLAVLVPLFAVHWLDPLRVKD